MIYVALFTWLGIILISIFLLVVKAPKRTASEKIIEMVQMDNDEENEILSEMIEYLKKNPTIKYRI